MAKKVAAISLAAGIGSRMKSNKTKQRMEILGKTVLRRTILAFDSSECISSITVVCRADEIDFAQGETKGLSKPVSVVVGGENRAESARLGFEAIPEDSDFVAIHDGARCLVTEEMIKNVAEAAFIHGAATASARVFDTLKRVDKDGYILSTEDRCSFMRAQTPQIFSAEIYRKALSAPHSSEVTDDNMLLERIGQRIVCVDTGDVNRKITEPADIIIAGSLLKEEERLNKMQIRVGHGYDVHRFASGRRLVLGGVDIPNDLGLLGHSDADVLIHAVMDALLGAAALGDIGKHFPDSSEEYKGISSMHLLARVKKLLDDNGYSVCNVDATLVLQRPKIATFVDKMRENIAFSLSIDKECVNVKATTEEKLGFTGSGEGAAAHAVALIQK